MKMLLSLAMAATVNVSPPSNHQNLVGFMDGAGLSYHCSAASTDTSGLRDICAGYLAGSVDQLFAILDAKPPARPLICQPAHMGLEDVRVSVLAYLKANPGALKTAAAHVVLNALIASYPCAALAAP